MKSKLPTLANRNLQHFKSPWWLLLPLGLILTAVTGSEMALMLYGLLVPLALVLIWKQTGRLTVRRAAILIVLAGITLRLAYVMHTDWSVRQHDVTGTYGHWGYIDYLLNHGSFPDTYSNQFYHPPLHHLLSAVWVKLQMLVGVSYDLARENLQLLTCLYSSICLFLSYRLFQEFNLRKGGLLVAVALVSFHPTFILMAGSINNDILSITFTLAAILQAVRWYKAPTLGRIVQIAIYIGLGMMTKLSAAMIAIAIGFLFLDKLVRSCKAKQLNTINAIELPRPGVLMRQFILFAAICVPLGLWWSVRNMLVFELPLTYVPMLSPDSWQYVGYHDPLHRLFDFSGYQFEQVFMGWNRERTAGFCYAGYNEFNPLIALLKTSVFGEFKLSDDMLSLAVCEILFWVNVVLVVFSLVAMMVLLLRGKTAPANLSWQMQVFLALIWIVIFGMYVQFCLTYEHVCTQNMRYAVPLIPLGAFFTGFAFEAVQQPAAEGSSGGIVRRLSKCLRYGVVGLTTAFCICSALMFVLLAV